MPGVTKRGMSEVGSRTVGQVGHRQVSLAGSSCQLASAYCLLDSLSYWSRLILSLCALLELRSTSWSGDLDANEARISEAMDWAEAEGADVLAPARTGGHGLSARGPGPSPGIRRGQPRCRAPVGGPIGPMHDSRGVCRSGQRSGQRIRRRHASATWPTPPPSSKGASGRRPTARSFSPTTACSTRSAISSPAMNPGFLWEIGGIPSGVSICEDIWLPGRSSPGPGGGRGQGPPEHQRVALSPRQGDRTGSRCSASGLGPPGCRSCI